MTEAEKSVEVPKLPRSRGITQTDMSKWFKDFTLYQKRYGEKWVVYGLDGEPDVTGIWRMVGGSTGPSIQPLPRNFVLVIVPADAAAAVRNAAETQNSDMRKENRKLIERLAGDKLVLAELIKDCVEPILPILMRTAGGPNLFNDPVNPLGMLNLIRSYNPHDRELIGNNVRNFYESEGFFKSNYQGALSVYEFMELKTQQWEHLSTLSERANTEAAGSVTMMSERERVMVLMSTIHSGYRLLKRRIDLGELPAVNTLVEFIRFVNKYETTAAEFRPKIIPPRKIFAAVTRPPIGRRICTLAGHTPGHQYGGEQCNNECKSRVSSKAKYAEEKREEVKNLAMKQPE